MIKKLKWWQKIVIGIIFFSVVVGLLFNMLFIMLIPFVIKGVDIPPLAGNIIIWSYVITSFVLAVKILGIK